MMIYLYAYVTATIILFVLDFIWLGVVAKKFYADQLGHLMADPIKLGLAAAFYLTYTVGIVVFAIKPALGGGSLWLAPIYGALFGFLAYGTYNFTNMATLKDWPVMMSIVDLSWGTCVTAITALTAAVILKYSHSL